MLGSFTVRPAELRDVEGLRALLRAYRQEAAAQECFVGFAEELAALPGRQLPPLGGMWILEGGDEALGCVALLPSGREAGEAEVRRLYLRPAARGQGLAERLVTAATEAAAAAGHARLRMETLPGMAAATALYRRLGWREEAAAGGRLLFRLELHGRRPAA